MRLKKIVSSLKKGAPPPPGVLPKKLVALAAALSQKRGRVMELSSLERMLVTLEHREPDRVPVVPLVNAAARRLTGAGFAQYSSDPEVAAEVLCASLEVVGGDGVALLWDLSVEASGFGQKVVFCDHSTARPDYDAPLLRGPEEYASLQPADWRTSGRMGDFIRLCELVVERVGFSALVSGFVFGPLGVLSMMRGAENLFRDCLLSPKEVIRACGAVNETLLEFTQAQCDTGVLGICIDSLYASRTALPKGVWEKIEGPFCRELAGVIRKNGLAVGIHNCGHASYFDAQIRSMEPDLISFAHLPDDCETHREMKERYGSDVTFLGMVPTPLLAHGTPHEVMEECRREIEVLGKDGGFILGPGCEYPPNLGLENAFAMVRAAKRYGKRP